MLWCWIEKILFSAFANFRGEISLFLISKVFSLLDAVIIFSKSSGDIYQNLLEIRAPLIFLTLPWYSSFIHPYKAKKHMFPDFSTHKVATGINSLWLETFEMLSIGKCFLSLIVVQVILYFPIDLCCVSLWHQLFGIENFWEGGEVLRMAERIWSSVQYHRNPFRRRKEEEKRLVKT